jgi:hypothetical protein
MTEAHASPARDGRRVAKAAVAAFVVFNILEFLVHGVLLKRAYHAARYLLLWNGEHAMNARRWPALLGYAALSWVVARVYAQGYEPEKAALEQGLKCGALLGLLLFSYHAWVDYMVYPVSAKLALAWWAAGVLELTIVGAVVSTVYRPEQPHSHPR